MSLEQPKMPENKKDFWEQKRAEVEKNTDGLGREIDENIKETVIAFLVHDFSVVASCEGHMDEEHILHYPWIDIEVPEPDNWEEDKDKQQEWRIKNLKQRKRAFEFMEEFYRDRQIPLDARLNFDHIGAFGAFRIKSFGADLMELLPIKEQEEKLKIYKKEMDDFAAFLKEKYFVEK